VGNSGSLRCDAHDVPISADYSCSKYVAAPQLAHARRVFPTMVPQD
jgi:hypothetical protein